MVNQQMLQGQWNQIKGKIKEKWGQLTDDDLGAFSGNLDQLVGAIQTRTGETRESIEGYLDQITAGGVSMAGKVGDRAREYMQHAAGTAQQVGNQMAESMRRGYSEAGHMVQERPGQSVMVALGAGMVTGLMLGLMFRSR